MKLGKMMGDNTERDRREQGLCFGFLSTAVIKTMTKSNLKRKGFTLPNK